MDKLNTAYMGFVEVLRRMDPKVDEYLFAWDPIPHTELVTFLRTDLPAFKDASRACRSVALSLHTSVPLDDLNTVDAQIEECGILLSAHMNETRKRSVENVIREQRRVIKELKKLSGMIHQAVEYVFAIK